MSINILKSTGEIEEFDRNKLRESLLRASASLVTTNDVIKKIEKKIREGMSTQEIYKIAFSLLNKKEKRTAMRYSLKRSIIDFGPTGFPFEKYIAEIFKKKGYKTMTGVILRGKCIEHEIDVLAYDENELVLIEVKFHNSLSIKTDTKVALYVKARWDDLKDNEVKIDKQITQKPTRELIVTNTNFTDNAIEYALCSNMGMISWNYPNKGSLFDLIHDTKLHPVTVMEELSKHQRQYLIDNGYITVNQVIENPKILNKIGLNQSKSDKLLANIKIICGIE